MASKVTSFPSRWLTLPVGCLWLAFVVYRVVVPRLPEHFKNPTAWLFTLGALVVCAIELGAIIRAMVILSTQQSMRTAINGFAVLFAIAATGVFALGMLYVMVNVGHV